jgi:hypothetical protein
MNWAVGRTGCGSGRFLGPARCVAEAPDRLAYLVADRAHASQVIVSARQAGLSVDTDSMAITALAAADQVVRRIRRPGRSARQANLPGRAGAGRGLGDLTAEFFR